MIHKMLFFTLISGACLFAFITTSFAQSIVQTPCGAVSTCLLKSSPGALFDAYVTTGSTAGYFYVYNGSSAPSPGSAITIGKSNGQYQEGIYVPANTSIGVSALGTPPIPFSSAVLLVFSSTNDVYTAATPVLMTGRVQ